MIKNVYCHACGCDRDMVESEGELICSACGTRFSVDDILNYYFALAFVHVAVEAGFTANEERDTKTVRYNEDEDFEQEGNDSDGTEGSEDISEGEAEFLFFEDETIDVEERVAHGNHNGIACIFEGDSLKAEKYFDQVLTLDEENTWAWFFKGHLKIENITYFKFENRDGRYHMPSGGFDNVLIASGENPEYSVQSKFYVDALIVGYATQLNSIAECFQKALQYISSSDLLTTLYPVAATMLAVAEARIRSMSILKNIAKVPSTSFLTSGNFLLNISNDLNAELEETTRQRVVELSGEKWVEDICAAADKIRNSRDFSGVSILIERLTEYQEYQTALEIWNKFVEPLIQAKEGEHLECTTDTAVDALLASTSLMDSIATQVRDWGKLDDDWLLFKQEAAQKAIDLRRSFIGLDKEKNGGHLPELIQLEAAEKNLHTIDSKIQKRQLEGRCQK